MIDSMDDILRGIEERDNVTILFAVESGSRAWGLNAPDSDFDIRFVYRRNDRKFYTGYKRNDNDTIIGFTDDNMYDWHGWDILKAIKHLQESNPSFIEWLYTPIIYIDRFGFLDSCRSVMNNMHTSLSLLYHYASMAKSNWADWISGRDDIICKKYLYVIRPVAMLHWLMSFAESSDVKLIIDIDRLLDTIRTELPDETYNDIQRIILQKRTNGKLGNCSPIRSINTWIEGQFIRFEAFTKKEGFTARSILNGTIYSLYFFAFFLSRFVSLYFFFNCSLSYEL